MSTETSASPCPIWVVAGWATIFLVGTDLFVVSPFLPLIGSEIGRSPQSLTVLVSAFSIVYAIACPIQGRIAERFSPKAVLVFGVSALAVANIYTALAPDFANLIVSRIVAGVAAASISPMIYALTANNTAPAQRASRLAVVNSGLIISLVLGAPVGLLLGSMTEWRLVFLGLAVLLAVMVPINVIAWARAGVSQMPHPATVRVERLVDAWPFLAGMIAWAASVYMTYTLLGTALQTRLHLDVWTASMVLSVFGLGATIGVLAGGKLADRIGARHVVRLSFVAMSAMFCLCAVALHFEVVLPLTLTLCLAAMSAYGFFPAIQAIAASSFTARRPTVLGLMSSALYVGITLGSFLGGAVYDTLGMTLVLIASAVSAAIGLLLTWAQTARRRSASGVLDCEGPPMRAA